MRRSEHRSVTEHMREQQHRYRCVSIHILCAKRTRRLGWERERGVWYCRGRADEQSKQFANRAPTPPLAMRQNRCVAETHSDMRKGEFEITNHTLTSAYQSAALSKLYRTCTQKASREQISGVLYDSSAGTAGGTWLFFYLCRNSKSCNLLIFS